MLYCHLIHAHDHVFSYNTSVACQALPVDKDLRAAGSHALFLALLVHKACLWAQPLAAATDMRRASKHMLGTDG